MKLTTAKQRVLQKWPNAYCYRLNPYGGVFAVIAGNPNSVFCTHLSAKCAWEETARRMKV